MRGRLSGSSVLTHAQYGPGKSQPQHPAGHAQDQAFQNRLAQQRRRACAQGQAYGKFALPANRAHQHQSGQVDAGDQQHYGDGQK